MIIEYCTLTAGYSLGIVKIEAFNDSYFVHQTVRVCHTDHPDSIVSSMACIVDHKNKFLWNQKLVLCLWATYSLGMVKMEAFEDSHFMPQAVRSGNTNHTGSTVSLMACIFDLKTTFLCNRSVGGLA